jgi:hypothetical protein
MAGVGRTRACAYPRALYPLARARSPARSAGRRPEVPAIIRLGAARALVLPCPPPPRERLLCGLRSLVGSCNVGGRAFLASGL